MFKIDEMKTTFVVLAIFLAVIPVGCGETDSAAVRDDEAPEVRKEVSERPMLSVRIRQDKTDDSKRIADIVFTKPIGRDGPRVAEIVLRYSDGLKYLSTDAGVALRESHKTLVAQAIENSSLRLIVYGADNANVINAGVLASITFETKTTEVNTLEILANRPIFAPNTANDGLLVPDPVTFE